MFRSPRSFAFLSICALALSALAEEEHGAKSPEAEKKAEAKPESKSADDKPKDEKPKESKGAVTIAGAEVKYVAKTGTLPILKDDGSGEKARVFFVYYAAADADGKPLASGDPGRRPITFCFNGGP